LIDHAVFAIEAGAVWTFTDLRWQLVTHLALKGLIVYLQIICFIIDVDNPVHRNLVFIDVFMLMAKLYFR